MKVPLSAEETIEFERVVLQRLEFVCRGEIAPKVFTQSVLSLKQLAEFVADKLVYELRLKLYSRPEWKDESTYTEHEEKVFVPLTWWDHLKDTLKRRYPKRLARLQVNVRMIKAEVVVRKTETINRICPHVYYEAPRDAIHLEWLMQAGPDRGRPME